MNSFFVALQFLTRLKIVNQTNWELSEFGKSVLSFPLVGCIIGLLTFAVYTLVSSFINSSLTMLILVVFEFLLTGGLHADGFMDTCDGLFSGRDRERKLEIMKDSRIGSNGVVGFVFLVLLKWQLLLGLDSQYMMFTLICMPLLSRYTLCLSITRYPYARPEGMGKAFAQYAPTHTVLITTLLAIIPVFVFNLPYLYTLGIALLANYILNHYLVKHLGGVTGDTYGFVIEVTEIIILAFIVAMSPILGFLQVIL